MKKPRALLISCEHGGNVIPKEFRYLFRGHQEVLQSHRGFDAGALNLAKHLAVSLSAPLLSSRVSRLLIDLNRSRGNRHLYSEFTRDLPKNVREEIVKKYYLPYRGKAENYAQTEIVKHRKRLIHVSAHSFIPEWHGQPRSADIGLLYDPARGSEVDFCNRWHKMLSQTGLKVRRNYPYAGKADSLTTYLRKRFSVNSYIGIELEVNQKHYVSGARNWLKLREIIAETLRQVLSQQATNKSSTLVFVNSLDVSL